jgi:hypothetical protein
VSPFGGTPSAKLAAAAEAGLEATRQAVLGSEAAAAGGLLDTVLLHWLDYEVRCGVHAILNIHSNFNIAIDSAPSTAWYSE